ncbi:YfiT family bacillithiol transferase [Flavobacterium sp.]|uniref:YfiT family bacillithiol transferase n=1 Tax=Flavobacterium sp. TaxID=239 RepID=UPI0039E70B03
MTQTELEKLQYPIGKFVKPEAITSEILEKCIAEIAAFPQKLRDETEQLDESQLETPYRPDGWTIRQLIHHCADSHMNCLIRIKWALTEDQPTIKFYHEDLWGNGIDNRSMPIEPTLQLLDGLHHRLAFIMSHLSETELGKSFVHPEHGKVFELREIICTYAWHGNHHLAHITSLKSAKGWN